MRSVLFNIDVNGEGGVLLGSSVICDGFRANSAFRVQTHIHDDHMDDFETSKQFQDVIASAATRDLLIADLNADLQYRENFIGLSYGEKFAVGEGEYLELSPNGHMLGSSQVMVSSWDGTRLGYSGDFQWPMESPVNVDALVIDSTYGAPSKVREYTQDDANEALLTLVTQQLKSGPLAVKGFRGTVQRALQVLSGQLKVPILCSRRMARDLEVFRRHGYAFDKTLTLDDPEAAEARKSNRYIRIFSKGDGSPSESVRKIVLGAYMSNPRDPVTRWPGGNYSVCLTDHADFRGTLEYVRATGAKFVVTDNTRGHGEELATELRARLGIAAVPSTNAHSSNWGE